MDLDDRKMGVMLRWLWLFQGCPQCVIRALKTTEPFWFFACFEYFMSRSGGTHFSVNLWTSKGRC